MNFVGIVTMLLSAIMLKEKPFLLQVIGAGVAILGIWLYFYESPSAEQLKGVLWLSFAVLCLALTNICMRLLHLLKGGRLSANQSTSIAILVGGLPIIFYGLSTDLPLSSIAWKDWLIIVSNGLFAVALPIVIFIQVLEYLKAYEASILATTGVIFTALFAIPVLGDYLTQFEILGMLLMMFGLYLVQKEKLQKSSDIDLN
jgi:drug/metabolite transporter (DMT)-like permease